MTTEYLEQQLEKWKRVLLLFTGASLTLAVSMVGILEPYTFSVGWVTVWIVLQLAVPAGLSMLWSKSWRQLPLTQRLNTAFGFLGVAWLCWLTIGFYFNGESFPLFVFIVLLGAALAILYLRLRRVNNRISEEIFP